MGRVLFMYQVLVGVDDWAPLVMLHVLKVPELIMLLVAVPWYKPEVALAVALVILAMVLSQKLFVTLR